MNAQATGNRNQAEYSLWHTSTHKIVMSSMGTIEKNKEIEMRIHRFMLLKGQSVAKKVLFLSCVSLAVFKIHFLHLFEAIIYVIGCMYVERDGNEGNFLISFQFT